MDTHDEFSGYCGIVTVFEVNKNYIAKYDIQNVGGEIHNELWVPSEELEIFNENILGEINILNAFFGKNFKPSENEDLNKKLLVFKMNEK